MQSIWWYLSTYQGDKKAIYLLGMVSLLIILFGIILGIRRYKIARNPSVGDVILLKQSIWGQILCTIAVFAIWLSIFYLVECWLVCFLCSLGCIGVICMLVSTLREL